MKIQNARVFSENGTFEERDLFITGSYITQSGTQDELIDGRGCYAIPGLVDIHFHGCVGYDFCDGTIEAVSAMANYQAANGVLAICPATVTLPEETLAGVCRCAAAFEASETNAALVGINLEGPFISEEKKGAQNPTYICKPNAAMFRRLQKASGGMIRLLDLAPEQEGAIELISELREDVVLSVAHTTADYDTASRAFMAGASHVTHLFNAMPPFFHRNPGVVGAAFDAPGCRVELITDGVHLHSSVVRAAFCMFGDDRIVFVSDSIAATGMPDGDYELGGLAIRVKGNRSVLRDGGAIAGSATNLMQCVRVAVKEMGIPLSSAVKCAAVNPAKAIGIFDRYGSLEAGKYANVVLLDEALNIRHILCRGKVIC